MVNTVITLLQKKGIRATKDFPLSRACTFRVGGVAELCVCPHNEEAMRDTILLLREHHVPMTVIGRGSNLFFGDGRLEGALVLTEEMCRMERQGTHILAECGVSLAALAAFAAQESLGGLEFARGIPGSLGGAVFMNAGAYGSAMSEVTVRTRAMDTATGNIFEITDHGFGYRDSVYMKHPEWICLSADLSLHEADRKAVEETMAELARKRRESQPLEYPSAGSYFKRPEGHFAGKLIEDAGLKGRQIGGARVSEKHAGFLINAGGATAADILALERVVREEVEGRFGVRLETEVRFIPTE